MKPNSQLFLTLRREGAKVSIQGGKGVSVFKQKFTKIFSSSGNLTLTDSPSSTEVQILNAPPN